MSELISKLSPLLASVPETFALIEIRHNTLRETCAAEELSYATAIGFVAYSLDGVQVSTLVEIVPGEEVPPEVVAQVREAVETIGLVPVVSADVTGRIVDRLMRPYFNRALRAVDDGIADDATLDQAIEMGLGYHVGPMARLAGPAMLYHHRVSAALYEDIGDPAYRSAARANIAARISCQNETEEE